MVEGERVRQAVARRPVDVYEATVAGLGGGRLRRHDLGVRLPLSIRREQMAVHRMDVGGAVFVPSRGGHPAERPITPVALLIEEAQGAKVAPILMELGGLAIRHHAVQGALFLEGAERPVAQPSGLARRLHRRQELRRPAQLDVGHGEVRGQVRNVRRATDAAGVQQRQRPVTAPAASARAGHEHFLPLLEEQPLLGIERLEGGEVHDDVVHFDVAEVWIQGGGQLEVAGRPPEHIRADLAGRVAGDAVEGARRIGKDAVFLARVHRFQAQGLKRGHELGVAPCQRRPRPTFVQMRHVARCEEADDAASVGLGHRQQGPRNEKLRRPAMLGARRRAMPSAIPVAAVLALRQDGAVRDAVAQIELEPEAVAPLAGRVQGEGEIVPGQVALVP